MALTSPSHHHKLKILWVQLTHPFHPFSPHCPSRPPWSDAASAIPNLCLCTAQAQHQLLGGLYL